MLWYTYYLVFGLQTPSDDSGLASQQASVVNSEGTCIMCAQNKLGKWRTAVLGWLALISPCMSGMYMLH